MMSSQSPQSQPLKTGSSVPYAEFRTDAFPVGERFELWREGVLPLFDSQLDSGWTGAEFRARLESYYLQHMFFGLSSFTPLRFRREHTHQPAEDADHLLVQYYLSGGYIGHNGYRDVHVGPGDISFLDLGRPLRTRACESEVLSLVIPREIMASLINPEQMQYGTVIAAGSAMANILSNHLLTVWRNLPNASTEELETINHSLLATIAGAFTHGASRQAESVVAIERASMEAICTYIWRNLRSENLTPAQLCRSFGCSRSQLYRMFAPMGGVAGYIRQARLTRCLDELTAFDGPQKRIVDVAFSWGFASQSHFCRLFRQAFGLTPSEAVEQGCAQRQHGLAHGSHAHSTTSPEFHRWLRQLA